MLVKGAPAVHFCYRGADCYWCNRQLFPGQWLKKDWQKICNKKNAKRNCSINSVAVAKAYCSLNVIIWDCFSQLKYEEARLDAALEASQNELSIRENAILSLGEEAAQSFWCAYDGSHDPEMIGRSKKRFITKKVNAEAGLKEVTDMFITWIFEGMEDNPYMQECSRHSRRYQTCPCQLCLVEIAKPCFYQWKTIVVAHDLTPSDTFSWTKSIIKALSRIIVDGTITKNIIGSYTLIAAVQRYK